MTSSPAAHATGRRVASPLLVPTALVVALLAVAAFAGGRLLEEPRPVAAGPTVVTAPERGGQAPPPAVATALDARTPAVARLDPGLRDALRRAASDAAADGVTFVVNSGWRSRERQEELLRDAVAQYGSREQAARWVATPETSPHVSGEAVDLGADGAAWLSEHGARYALCQIYRNEPWHYELRPSAVTQGCPAMYADPSKDPRLSR